MSSMPKEFKGQKGNTYFIIYDKKTTENMARKNVRLAEKPAEANTPEMERQEAINSPRMAGYFPTGTGITSVG